MEKCNCSKDCECETNTIKEHVDRIKEKFAYKINEARYSLVGNVEDDDSVPEEVWSSPQPITKVDSIQEAGEEEEELPTPENPVPDEQQPENQPTGEELPPADGDDGSIPDDTVVSPEMSDNTAVSPEMSVEPEQPTVDELQNNILKSSISAMQKMNSELERIEGSVNQLNNKIDTLNTDVQQVKEPTNVEKLVSRKDDSHPYYYNLNDMWKDNWFQGRRQLENSEGMKQLDDGSFIADFDTLPKYTDYEIKDSFNF